MDHQAPGHERERGIVQTLLGIIRDFRTCAKQCLLYEIGIKTLEFAILAPVSAVIAAYFITFTGRPSLSNEQIIAFVLSIPGLAAIFLAGTSILCLWLLELSGLLIIGYAAVQGMAVSLRTVLSELKRSLSEILAIGIIQFFFIFAILVPFAALAGLTYSALLSDYDIYYLWTQRPPVFFIALIIGCVLLVLCLSLTAFLLARWLFAVPACLFEGLPARAAMRRSAELIRGNTGSVLITLALAVAVFVLSSAVITGITWTIGSLTVSTFFSVDGAPVLVAAGVLALYTAVTGILSFVAFPLFGLLVARLYADRYHRNALQSPPAPGMYPEREPPRQGTWAGRALVLGILLVFGLSVIVLAAAIDRDLKMEDRVQVTAHRGSSRKAPENTLSAIRRAVADGADFAEIDVQETADGVVVLLHDTDLRRVAGLNKRIWEIDFADLRELDVGSWFDSQFVGERVPTLQEAVDAAAGKIKLNIELKFNGHDRRLTESTVDVIEKNNFTDGCIVTSFNQTALEKIRELDPKIRIGLIVAKAWGDVIGSDVDLFSLSARITTPAIIRNAHGRGREVHVWSVNDPVSVHQFIDMRVDNIITDHPVLVKEIIKQRGEMSYGERLMRTLRHWIQ